MTTDIDAVPSQTLEEQAATLQRVYDLVGMGALARTPGILLTNLQNMKRRSDCLSGIEQLFTYEVPDEDMPDEMIDECDLNWGQDRAQYVETFKAALPAFIDRHPEYAPTAVQAAQTEGIIAAGGAQEPVAGVDSRPQNFSGCIEWSSYKNRQGYGTLKADGRISLAHRVMYCDYNGVSPESIQDLVVRHACDNPGCINPAHLLLGTHADNTQDKVERGRQAKGERNGQSKLTSHQVAQIRSLYVRGSREFGTPALARKFGVGETTIRKIILNLRWVHVSSTGDQS